MAVSGTVKLIMRQGPKPNQVFELDKEVYALGREAGNDIVIEDSQVSRHHAQLTRQGNSYLIEDAGSTNGTFVNGSRVSGSVLLANGDMVGLADTVVLAVQVSVSVDAGATMVGRAATSPTTEPAFTPPAQPQVVPPRSPQPAFAPPAPPPAYLPPTSAAVDTENRRRMLLIGCGCLALLAVVAGIAVVAWSFIDCRSFQSAFPFLFPPFQC